MQRLDRRAAEPMILNPIIYYILIFVFMIFAVTIIYYIIRKPLI
jgi:hypothetical protein